MDTSEIITRLIVSVLLGAVIGAEREYRDKSAGLRTMILISAGSSLFMLISILLTNGTTDRIASTIVTGIGFIGGGVIFKSDKEVAGLTTAAAIWMSAAIGMASGAGLFLPAVLFTVVTLLVLAALSWSENVIDKLNQDKTYEITTPFQQGIIDQCELQIKEMGLGYKLLYCKRNEKEITLSWKISGSKKNHSALISKWLNDERISAFNF